MPKIDGPKLQLRISLMGLSAFLTGLKVATVLASRQNLRA